MSVKKGNIVKVEYEGRLESGEVFDSSQHGDHSHPLTFEVGSGQVISGFDNAVNGMKLNEEKEITIPSSEAYGDEKPELFQKIPKSMLKLEQEPKAGMILSAKTPDGRVLQARISEVDKDSITVDLNHPLAGKNLIFKLKVISIEDKK